MYFIVSDQFLIHFTAHNSIVNQFTFITFLSCVKILPMVLLGIDLPLACSSLCIDVLCHYSPHVLSHLQ